MEIAAGLVTEGSGRAGMLSRPGEPGACADRYPGRESMAPGGAARYLLSAGGSLSASGSVMARR